MNASYKWDTLRPSQEKQCWTRPSSATWWNTMCCYTQLQQLAEALCDSWATKESSCLPLKWEHEEANHAWHLHDTVWSTYIIDERCQRTSSNAVSSSIFAKENMVMIHGTWFAVGLAVRPIYDAHCAEFCLVCLLKHNASSTRRYIALPVRIASLTSLAQFLSMLPASRTSKNPFLPCMDLTLFQGYRCLVN